MPVGTPRHPHDKLSQRARPFLATRRDCPVFIALGRGILSAHACAKNVSSGSTSIARLEETVALDFRGVSTNMPDCHSRRH
jgi:hypothetical protein